MLRGETLVQQILSINMNDWDNNTNLKAAFERVLEIAEKNQMSTGAVKMALMRTRNKLKEALKKEGLL